MVAAHKDIHFLDRKHILLSIKIPAKLLVVFMERCHVVVESKISSFTMIEHNTTGLCSAQSVIVSIDLSACSWHRKKKSHERELAAPSSVTKKNKKTAWDEEPNDRSYEDTVVSVYKEEATAAVHGAMLSCERLPPVGKPVTCCPFNISTAVRMFCHVNHFQIILVTSMRVSQRERNELFSPGLCLSLWEELLTLCFKQY